MPVTIQENKFVLPKNAVERIWHEVVTQTSCDDDTISVACISGEKIRQLNNKYRKVNKKTNVLTFSYGGGNHDIVLCLEVARNEATEREIDFKDYVALLLVHAFLHVSGMDHERSAREAREVRQMEKRVLEAVGLVGDSL